MDKLQAAAEEYSEKYPYTLTKNRTPNEALQDAFLAGHAHANRWVSVEEQLPEFGQKVIAYGKLGYEGWEPVTFGQRNADALRRIFTHWMAIELPEKPNK